MKSTNFKVAENEELSREIFADAFGFNVMKTLHFRMRNF